MSNIYSKKDYKMLTDNLKEEYSKNPKKANKIAYDLLYNSGKIKYGGYDKFINNADVIMLAVLLGFVFLKSDNYTIIFYLIGLSFFSAVKLVLLNTEIGGIISLHIFGLIGLTLMNVHAAIKIYESPILSDGKMGYTLYFVIPILLLIAYLIYGTLYFLSKELQSKPFNKTIPILLGGLATIILQLTAFFIK